MAAFASSKRRRRNQIAAWVWDHLRVINARARRLVVFLTPVVLLLIGLLLKFDADACHSEVEGDEPGCEEDLERVERLADAILTASGVAALVALVWWRRLAR